MTKKKRGFCRFLVFLFCFEVHFCLGFEFSTLIVPCFRQVYTGESVMFDDVGGCNCRHDGTQVLDALVVSVELVFE